MEGICEGSRCRGKRRSRRRSLSGLITVRVNSDPRLAGISIPAHGSVAARASQVPRPAKFVSSAACEVVMRPGLRAQPLRQVLRQARR